MIPLMLLRSAYNSSIHLFDYFWTQNSGSHCLMKLCTNTGNWPYFDDHSSNVTLISKFLLSNKLNSFQMIWVKIFKQWKIVVRHCTRNMFRKSCRTQKIIIYKGCYICIYESTKSIPPVVFGPSSINLFDGTVRLSDHLISFVWSLNLPLVIWGTTIFRTIKIARNIFEFLLFFDRKKLVLHFVHINGIIFKIQMHKYHQTLVIAYKLIKQWNAQAIF